MKGSREKYAPLALRVEAAAYLLAARFALAVFSFHRLTQFFNRPVRRRERTGSSRAYARQEVKRAMVWAHGALKPTCLHKAMASQAMLRRRRVGATLYYGAVTLPKCGLQAHAWVQDGREGVVGHIAAYRYGYKVLACYPETNQREIESIVKGA